MYKTASIIGTPKRCAEGVYESGLRWLEIEPDSAWIAQRINGGVIVAPNGTRLVLDETILPEKGYVLERKIFDKHMAMDAGRAGSRIMVKTLFQSLRRESDENGEFFIVDCQRMDKSFQIKARIVIAADGPESHVARKAGIKKISVIPLKSKYLPKKGDVVIGKIDDVRFSMWGVDINSPYPGILPASEVFGRDKKDLSRVFDIGDVLFLRIVDVDEVKKVKLGLKGRGMGKFKGGIIVDIAPTKVPRLIGKKGSMINMIKDKTGCKIVVGQNGLVWVKGKQDMEQIVKDTIKLIEKEAHTSGLTDRIKNRLCLLIDGELPEEENEEMEENFDDAFKKPELQDFSFIILIKIDNLL